ncbi:hypothetical protein CI109_104677 [Kwoniella shandongensis]|uniref:Uncharacterized protein n=1 Tax=Kwoniella shandongensis TaxID=1734106 RepID=A0A5M6BY77_9TREE|nr:uncharacterized protein CI109_004842 [Kwoniella shandongensis]KAA5526842.1 hypothetical protein CI109_004842 [Kwoniella shandongensis]
MSSSRSRSGMNGGLDLPSLTPLPDEEYPRIVDSRRTPDRGYYIALGLVLSVWMITPLSYAYLIWYTLLSPGLSGAAGLTAAIFAAYALTEVLFSIYTLYLTSYVQKPTPPSSLPITTRTNLFLKVLHSGLTYPVPPKGVISHPNGNGNGHGNGDADADADVREAEIEQAEEDFQKGLISVAELYHIRDREYEESVGMRERRRVGKMTEGEKDVITAFVEDEEGEREKKLRDEIEGNVLPNGNRDKWGYEGIADDDGKIIKLHPWDKRAIDFRERLRTWFNHAPWSSIRKENILSWLAWSCYGLPLDEVRKNEEYCEFLDYSLDLLEARTGTDFEEGYTPDVEVLRLTLDPVNARARPLILYALSNLVNTWLREVVYPYQGMGLYREGEIEYLIRIPKDWTPEKGKTVPNALPVVYMHGLGFGLLQSHLLIKHLIKSLPTHPLLIPLSPHTSQSLFHPRHLRPWTRPELVESMKTICKQWGFWDEEARGDKMGGVSMLSHSNGSVAHGWILKDCPKLIKRSTFVDPVVFCLWEGDVCHSFCYRRPATALELLLYYFIACEVGIANYIQRNFDWTENTLFFDEIPNATDPTKTAFFLGGHDIIIDASRVRRYLERHGVTNGIHWDQNAGHGDGLAGSSRDRVVMYVGTGSTSGWEGWLKSGRRRHSLGIDDFVNRGGRRKGE